jgi:hypothetical protein
LDAWRGDRDDGIQAAEAEEGYAQPLGQVAHPPPLLLTQATQQAATRQLHRSNLGATWKEPYGAAHESS